jgi:hypothetical protein
MTAPPAGISEADWASTPASVREIVGQVQALRDENEQLRAKLTALATELAGLRQRIGRNSRNSSRPPSSDVQGYRYAEGFAYKAARSPERQWPQAGWAAGPSRRGTGAAADRAR